MPAAEFELRVKDFAKVQRDPKAYEIVIVRSDDVDKSGGKVKVVRLDHSEYAKPGAGLTTIQIEPNSQDHVTLRFTITDGEGKAGRYFPIGVELRRADKTKPIGIPITTHAKPHVRKELLAGKTEPEDTPWSPFSRLKLNEPLYTLEFDVVRLRVRAKTDPEGRRSHTTYRFAIFIQEPISGVVRKIDPEIENPY
ncbi:MAG: hypothetical protein Q7S40_17825 [Opitutaceae bacterium]|nr:hypothetical protein [Opitutaceae bacterium]